MENFYKKYLYDFFNKSNYYFHISYRLENILNKEFKIINSEKGNFYSSNALVISDWTGETENGWELPFHTNVFAITDKENYEVEMDKMKSRENLINFAQSFEVFQGFLKDCLTQKNEKILRSDLKFNDKILQRLTEEGGVTFNNSSNKNNNNYNFKVLFNICVELRHSITHSNGIIEKNKIIKDKYSEKLFNHIMPEAKIEKSKIILYMPFISFRRNMKILNEFAFQLYKILSIESGLDYKL